MLPPLPRAAFTLGGGDARLPRAGCGKRFVGTTGASAGSWAAPSPAGEWSLRVSLMGCDGALSGHLFLDEQGRAAYIADGEQIVGRGVGHWTQVGNAAALEMDVYQYAAAAVDVPERPHRFRGVWELAPGGGRPRALSGDWYFCPEGSEPPRLVGSFDAVGSTNGQIPPALAGTSSSGAGPAPRVTRAASDAVIAELDGKPELRSVSPAASFGSRTEPYRVGSVPNVYYVPDWIEAEQEKEFMAIADSDMRQWDDMRTRSSQEWGAGDRCVCGRGLTREPLPASQQPLAQALHHLGAFDGALYPMNSVRINGYHPGQGIHPHCDGPVYYPMVAILSLGSPCIFSFYPQSGSEDTMKWDQENNVPGGHQDGSVPICSVLLEPRSLLIFSHAAFWNHRHGISAVKADQVTPLVCNLAQCSGSYRAGDSVQRQRRVSLTMRHLLPRCACQG